MVDTSKTPPQANSNASSNPTGAAPSTPAAGAPAKPATPGVAGATGTPALNVKPAAPTPADGAVKNAPAPGKPVPAMPIVKPAFVIQSLTATKSNKYIKALVYGRPGVGKTSFCGSAVDVAGMRDVLLLSVEQGSMSLHDNPRIKNPELIDEISAVNFKVCSTVKDFLAAHCIFRDQGNDDKLWELQRKYMPGVEDRLRKYRTVIIDSLSEIETLNMYDLLSVNPDAAASLASEMPVAEFKEYKQNNNKMQLLIDRKSVV